MPPAKTSKRPATSAPGVKVLITAASLAATVGGWALISANDNSPELPISVPTAESQPDPVALSINLKPLPTIVPPPTLQPQLVTASNRPAVSSKPAPVPQPAAPALPALRVVSVPTGGGGGGGGAPAATTRSSR